MALRFCCRIPRSILIRTPPSATTPMIAVRLAMYHVIPSEVLAAEAVVNVNPLTDQQPNRTKSNPAPIMRPRMVQDVRWLTASALAAFIGSLGMRARPPGWVAPVGVARVPIGDGRRRCRQSGVGSGWASDGAGAVTVPGDKRPLRSPVYLWSTKVTTAGNCNNGIAGDKTDSIIGPPVKLWAETPAESGKRR